MGLKQNRISWGKHQENSWYLPSHIFGDYVVTSNFTLTLIKKIISSSWHCSYSAVDDSFNTKYYSLLCIQPTKIFFSFCSFWLFHLPRKNSENQFNLNPITLQTINYLKFWHRNDFLTGKFLIFKCIKLYKLSQITHHSCFNDSLWILFKPWVQFFKLPGNPTRTPPVS